MSKTLISIALWATLGALLGAWLGAHIGWAVFALGLLIMVLVSAWQLRAIGAWVQDLDAPPPPSVGPWDDVLAPIYRRLRKDRGEIQDLHARLDSIVAAAEALPDGAVTLDESMQLLWCNKIAATHLGLDPSADRGNSILNIVRAPEFARYVRQGNWGTGLLLHIDDDDQERSLLIQLIHYGLDRFLLVSRDVTQMEKLETTRKDFVANVSHELRTPLTVLSGFLETLHDMPAESMGAEQHNQYLALMLEQARRMQAIINDLLALSTLESTPHAPGEPVRMSTLVKHALEQGRALSNGQHVFVEQITEDLGVLGVETELASAISNLLTNAINYTPHDGTITVSWYQTEDGGACYSVQDTGIGIAPQDLPRLTERFYRVDRGRSRATGGTGLGLAITKHVAMRHDAELRIRSRFGAGSCFTLEFPAERVLQLEE